MTEAIFSSKWMCCYYPTITGCSQNELWIDWLLPWPHCPFILLLSSVLLHYAPPSFSFFSLLTTIYILPITLPLCHSLPFSCSWWDSSVPPSDQYQLLQEPALDSNYWQTPERDRISLFSSTCGASTLLFCPSPCCWSALALMPDHVRIQKILITRFKRNKSKTLQALAIWTVLGIELSLSATSICQVRSIIRSTLELYSQLKQA